MKWNYINDRKYKCLNANNALKYIYNKFLIDLNNFT